MEHDMRGIVAFADALSSVDTSGTEPAAQAAPNGFALRADEVGKPLGRDELLAGVPEARDGFIRVPRVAE